MALLGTRSAVASVDGASDVEGVDVRKMVVREEGSIGRREGRDENSLEVVS